MKSKRRIKPLHPYSSVKKTTFYPKRTQALQMEYNSQDDSLSSLTSDPPTKHPDQLHLSHSSTTPNATKPNSLPTLKSHQSSIISIGSSSTPSTNNSIISVGSSSTPSQNTSPKSKSTQKPSHPTSSNPTDTRKRRKPNIGTGTDDNARLGISSSLRESDGNARVKGSVWPKRGENTFRGVMQHIICQYCDAHVHWACAGLPDEIDLTGDDWTCPDCHTLLSLGDEEQYYPESVIGRKTIPATKDERRQVIYLVKWYGYPIEESTWEKSTEVLIAHKQEFQKKCDQLGFYSNDDFLLPETKTFFKDLSSSQLGEMIYFKMRGMHL
ncbi:hypothetical protein TREMEDRAFT_62564 [Tremella mesenterica DSM 1558]|uniref:uncharacterized protein n=1 Tax=Tremella mesenterica (strain ATCC 24925 / CBS 8224 / DSM 1558 / NBRC 9311 / NRRL Y-6157 / RJB 2259-6 / UBC 559-6) TaxID=578456 RepID=UPI0003F48DC8|nr:uncharacterized protein TREMEDRAFT_62564 [Tremella mesenterica DSM 1558]EIW69696.1 hypothetical protein TREMEDRAFT_62564 [Tremella mesenterica DSM 1558]